MAIKKKKSKKKKPEQTREDGIHLERSKSRTQKGQFYLAVWDGGKETTRSSENYHNLKDLLDSMENATKILAEYFIMNNNKRFHDNTGGK